MGRSIFSLGRGCGLGPGARPRLPPSQQSLESGDPLSTPKLELRRGGCLRPLPLPVRPGVCALEIPWKRPSFPKGSPHFAGPVTWNSQAAASRAPPRPARAPKGAAPEPRRGVRAPRAPRAPRVQLPRGRGGRFPGPAVTRPSLPLLPPPRRPADGSFPMSQRSFPASFWNSAYQAPVPAPLGSPLAAAHSELPFAAADPYSPAALHSHLHQGAAEPWHHAHPHHAHPHHPYALGSALGAQAAAYPRPAAVHEVYAPHFDPRYGPLLMPAASGRPARLAPAPAPAPGSPPCELSKGEPAGAAWAAPGGPFASPAGDVAQGLGLSVDSGKRERELGLPGPLLPCVRPWAEPRTPLSSPWRPQ